MAKALPRADPRPGSEVRSRSDRSRVVSERTDPEGRGAPAAVLLSPQDPAWSAFVLNHPDATPFHHPAWSRTLADAYGFPPGGLALLGAGGRIEAALPLLRVGRTPMRRRAVALPFTDSLGPLGPTGAADGLAERLERARRELGLGALEVRAELAGPAAVQQAAPVGYRHALELGPAPQRLRESFDRSRVERKLRRAERAGLVVRRSDEREALLGIFWPLHVATRRRLGVPVQPRRFFEALHERMLRPGLGFVVSAELEGEPVAAAVYLAWNRRLVYKFSASDRSHGDVGAAQAVVWEAIRWGAEHGYAELDFGRTESEHEGLRTFKRAWGSRELPLAYTTLGRAPGRPGTAGAGRAGAILGTVLRHSPELLTRAIGRLAYRYTA